MFFCHFSTKKNKIYKIYRQKSTKRLINAKVCESSKPYIKGYPRSRNKNKDDRATSIFLPKIKQQLVKLFLLVRLTSDHIFAYSSRGTRCFSDVFFLEEKPVHLEFLFASVTGNTFVVCLCLDSIKC